MSLLRQAVLRFSVRNRHRKAARIRAFVEADGRVDGLLLCGALGVAVDANQGIVERSLAGCARRTYGFDVVAHGTEEPWPFFVADGRRMPLRTGAVDVAVSNAVIEHVGGEQQQRAFVDEHVRVARSWVITTPNRWFPVESHTATLLRHWSPRWRAQVSDEVFTRLLSRREFQELLPDRATVSGHWWSPTFTAYYRGG